MSFRTEADDKYDKLKDLLMGLQPQCNDCWMAANETISYKTEGSDELSQEFRAKVYDLQNAFLNLDRSINTFLSR